MARNGRQPLGLELVEAERDDLLIGISAPKGSPHR